MGYNPLGCKESDITERLNNTTKKTYDQPRQCIKKQRCHFADQSPHS